MESIFSVKDFEDFCRNKTVSTGIQEIIKILRPDLVESISDEKKINSKVLNEINIKRENISKELGDLHEKQRTEGLSDNDKYKLREKISELTDISNELYRSSRPYDKDLTQIELDFLNSIGAEKTSSRYIVRNIFTEVFGKRFLSL